LKFKAKKKGDKYLVLFSTEEKVEGFYLTYSEIKVLSSNINEILENNKDQSGDDIS
jgi:hypothetical protein